MRKKRLLLIIVVAILAVSIPVTLALIHRGQQPSNGGIAEVPSDNSTTESPVTPTTPSTLTMLSITEGNVFVMKAGTDSWIEAQVGMSLEPGDTVKSGNSSGAQITFFDGSTIDLQADTEVEIASLNISDTGSTTIGLKQAIGNTISRVTELVDSASRYEVETPACVAAVRGSGMLVKVIGDGTTWVTNQEGDIWVTANGVELKIPEGRTCIIIPGQPPQLVPLTGGGGGGFTPHPRIAITKIPGVMQAHEGDAINYTYIVTNRGNVPLSNVSVTDDMIENVTYQSGDTNGDGRLGTHETWVFTAIYNVTAEDPSPLVNTAAAAGTYAGAGTVITWTTASVDILRPTIAITKTADQAQAHDGDTITYTYTITNPGGMPISAISVTDNMTNDVTYQSGDTNEDEILDGNETWVFTATYNVTVEDPSPLVNTATVSGIDALSRSVESEDTASVDILRPAIAITKTAAPTQAHEGDTITYTYTITNSGNTPLSSILVTDDKAGSITYEDGYQSGDTNENEILDGDETWVFTATYTITNDDVSPLVNTATVSGTDALSRLVESDEDTASVDILRPAIAITKTADRAQAHEGDIITYTYTITNPGNTPLSAISVTDNMTEDVSYQSGDTNENEILDGDETWVFTATYTITNDDVSPLVNTATVSGTDALSRSVESEDTASVDILRPVVERVRFPDEGTAYIGYEDQQGGDFDYNDFGMNMFIEEVYVDDCLTEINMEFESAVKLAGGNHDIHILRTLSASTYYTYTITRSTLSRGTETPAVTDASGHGNFNIILFDTAHFTSGATVTIHIEITDGCESYNSTPTPPRGDLSSIWAYYDPYMNYRTTPATLHHIGDWQPAVNPLPTGYDVPYILVIPMTDWQAPAEGQCITNLYPYFDDYYATGSPEDWYEIKAPD
jgi:uncharacterized repeat protein (TIGR01451 family)